jgi:hypothetical protein
MYPTQHNKDEKKEENTGQQGKSEFQVNKE